VQSASHSELKFDELVRRTDGLQPWRRAFHLVGGSAVAWLVYTLSPQAPATRSLFATLLAIAFTGDMVRLRSEKANRFIFRVFGPLMCPREADRPSLTYFLLGVFIVLWLPGEGFVVPALLVLSIADPAASVLGRLWGAHPLGKGTAEGAITFFAVAAAILFPFAGGWVALTVAAVVAGTEVLLTDLDDNLVIPIVTASCLRVLSG